MNKYPDYITQENLKTFIEQAFKEDIGPGDYSTLSTIPDDLQQTAKLLVKQDCVLAGIEMAKEIFHHYDKEMEMEILLNDGDQVKVGDIAFLVHGKARSILSTERLVLNCMQRMSGIASKAKKITQLVEHTNAKVLDTRKTTPNFRIAEKWAAHIGGAHNHRYGLYDMVMLKDNHIDYCGSITKAVDRSYEYLKSNNLHLKIEVETRNLEEVKEAVETKKVDRIMLDNMNVETMKKALDIIQKQCETEASGGITEENIVPIAETGIDYISLGAITHSAENMDLSLKAVNK